MVLLCFDLLPSPYCQYGQLLTNCHLPRGNVQYCQLYCTPTHKLDTCYIAESLSCSEKYLTYFQIFKEKHDLSWPMVFKGKAIVCQSLRCIYFCQNILLCVTYSELNCGYSNSIQSVNSCMVIKIMFVLEILIYFLFM